MRNRRSLPLLIGATVLALGASAVPSLQKSAAQSRDLKRLESLFQINRALVAWQRDHEEPLVHVPDPYAGGWETTRNGSFLTALTEQGYLPEIPLDPVNNKKLQFRYHCYSPAEYGNDKPFYILALTGFESDSVPANLATAFTTIQTGGRDWGQEFPMVLGGPQALVGQPDVPD